jgi:hypothetical protein
MNWPDAGTAAIPPGSPNRSTPNGARRRCAPGSPSSCRACSRPLTTPGRSLPRIRRRLKTSWTSSARKKDGGLVVADRVRALLITPAGGLLTIRRVRPRTGPVLGAARRRSRCRGSSLAARIADLRDHRSLRRISWAAASSRSARRTNAAAYRSRSPERCPVAFSFATAWFRLTPIRRTSPAARMNSPRARGTGYQRGRLRRGRQRVPPPPHTRPGPAAPVWPPRPDQRTPHWSGRTRPVGTA